MTWVCLKLKLDISSKHHYRRFIPGSMIIGREKTEVPYLQANPTLDQFVIDS